jgi:DNA (cytosine-5)-methyltransferase 3A
MKKEFRDKISELLWVEPILIDSALLSAQHRERYYWTNIPWVVQPQDKWLLLKDILQDNVDEKYYLSEKMKSFFIANDKKQREQGNWFRFNVSEWDKKASSVTTRAWSRMDDNFICATQPIQTSDSLWAIVREHNANAKHQQDLIQSYEDKCRTIPAWTHWSTPHLLKTIVDYNPLKIRKLTPIECERLQTLPDNYTEWVSNTQRYKMLGNWWTVDVISHIFSFIPKQNG